MKASERSARCGRAIRLPSWLGDGAPRHHRNETQQAVTRRRRVVAGVSAAGAGLLRLSLCSPPASRRFYATTLGVAATWAAGGLAAGPLGRGRMQAQDRTLRRPIITPVLAGVGAFGLVYPSALLARRTAVLDGALRRILRFTEQGSGPLVLLTTLANGVGEEIFFRGAVYSAVGEKHPVAASTAVYTLTTVATGNPALVMAAAAMGTLFGLERRASGGIQAPLLTHLTWATLVLRYLPPLFPSAPSRDRKTPQTENVRPS